MSSSKPVVLITGANTGLGLEAVKALLADSEYEILLGSRSTKKAEEALASIKDAVSSSKSSVTVVQIDVSSDDSIKAAFDTVSKQFGRLDVLVNNAGINNEKDAADGKITVRQAFNDMWNVNVAGAHITTEIFMPLLIKSSTPRLVFITSGTSSLAETEIHEGFLAKVNEYPSKGWPKDAGMNPVIGYRSSKTGLNMLMTQWERILHNDGVKVFAVSPGFLATGLAGIGAEKLRQIGAIEPHIGGEFLRDVIVGRRDDQAGKIIRKDAVQVW